jgi:GT2 family glycosyltransferase
MIREGIVTQLKTETIDGSCGTVISISVVSHGQLDLVFELLKGLREYCSDLHFELILTLNQKETLPFAVDSFPYPIKLLANPVPLGFAANQNQAFSHANGRYFCVINPDIRFTSNPFTTLIACLEDSRVGVIAPAVLGASGALEDSARRFPTPIVILQKFLGQKFKQDYPLDKELIYPDWVAGMFMLFPRRVFEHLAGFDERYFLYYEDVDICARMRMLGYAPVVCLLVSVVHEAQRHSHRNLKYLQWHLRSMVRFFVSFAGWRIRHGSLSAMEVRRHADNGTT